MDDWYLWTSYFANVFLADLFSHWWWAFGPERLVCWFISNDLEQINIGIFEVIYGVKSTKNERPLGAKGPPMVGEEVRNKEVGTVGS